MESSSFAPSSPATPLHSASPSRINRQPELRTPCSPSRTPLQSPHLKDDPFFSRPPRSSDVQGKVLQFNQLAEALTPKRKDNEAALRRAVLGREEAEARMRRIEEENEMLQASLEESSGRELKVAQRIETMMEEVQRHKEAGQRANAVYEKEIRRARKEAFKSSSALVKLQEELKNARNRYTLMREECEDQKRKLESKEQDAFSAQYKLVEKQDELDQLQQRLKLVEQERDALRTNLKEEEIARIAAEGKIPLPPATPNDEFSSPKKPSFQTPTRTYLASNYANEDPFQNYQQDARVDELQRELMLERRRYHEVEGLVQFMKLECQLKACSCRRAERDGALYVHDISLVHLYAEKAPAMDQDALDASDAEELPTPVEESVIVHRNEVPAEPETLIEFSPVTGTFRKSKSPLKPVTSIAAAMEGFPGAQHVSEPEISTQNASSEVDTTPIEARHPPEVASILTTPESLGHNDCMPSSSLSNQKQDMVAQRPSPTPSSTGSSQQPARPQSQAQSHAGSRVGGHEPTRSRSRVGVRDSIRSQSRAGPRESIRTASRAGTRNSIRSESRNTARESIRSQSRVGVRAESRARPHDSSRAPSRASGTRAVAAVRAVSPQQRAPAMRVVETSQTVRIPLVDPDTPTSPKAEKAKMPFTPGRDDAGDWERNKMPFTPGATKTREEALQSIRRWREANSRTGPQDGNSKARSRSVTHTGGATTRRASPVRRDITK